MRSLAAFTFVLLVAGAASHPASAQLRTDNDQSFTLDTGGVLGTPESGAGFGAALTAGDFDGNGFHDLAAAAPLEDKPGSPFSILDVGAVYLLGGSSAGLGTASLHARLQTADLRAAGSALAAADFDLDGFDDLVVGGPEVTVDGATDGGRIAIYPGSLLGMVSAPVSWTSSNTIQRGDRFGSALLPLELGLPTYPALWAGLPDADLSLGSGDNRGRWEIYASDGSGLDSTAETTLFEPFTSSLADVRYGASATAGDFDGDGWIDLAVGAPDWDDDTPGPCAPCDVGRVHLLRNVNGALLYWSDFDLGDVVFNTGSGGPQADAHFGAVLAAGDLDGDGFDDLAIGVPDANLGSYIDAGYVVILFGSVSGLVLDGTPRAVSRRDGAGESSGAFMGAALAIADFDGDSIDDLAVGVPGDVVDGVAGGSVLLYLGGSIWTPNAAWQQRLAQGTGGVAGSNETGDRFGAALATADFDGDCRSDLAVGAPGENVRAGQTDEGALHVFYGDRFPFFDGFERGGLLCWDEAVGGS